MILIRHKNTCKAQARRRRQQCICGQRRGRRCHSGLGALLSSARPGSALLCWAGREGREAAG